MKNQILFVCYANAFRSPVAEVLFKEVVKKSEKGGIKVDSAGISDKYVGLSGEEALEPSLVELLLKHNIDLRKRKVKLINKKMVKNASKIIVFDNHVMKRLLKKFPETKDNVYLIKKLAGERDNPNIKNLKGKSIKEHEDYIKNVKRYLEKSFRKIVSD